MGACPPSRVPVQEAGAGGLLRRPDHPMRVSRAMPPRKAHSPTSAARSTPSTPISTASPSPAPSRCHQRKPAPRPCRARWRRNGSRHPTKSRRRPRPEGPDPSAVTAAANRSGLARGAAPSSVGSGPGRGAVRRRAVANGNTVELTLPKRRRRFPHVLGRLRRQMRRHRRKAIWTGVGVGLAVTAVLILTFVSVPTTRCIPATSTPPPEPSPLPASPPTNR